MRRLFAILLTICTIIGCAGCDEINAAQDEINNAINEVLNPLAGGSNISDRYSSDEYPIQTVQNGYLGEYTDITVHDLFKGYYMNFHIFDTETWSSGTTDIGETVVQVDYESEDFGTATIQFTMLDEDRFYVNFAEDPFDEIEDGYGVSAFLNNVYFTWYIIKNEENYYADPDGFEIELIQRLDTIDGAWVQYGASADYSGDRTQLHTLNGATELGVSVPWLLHEFGFIDATYYQDYLSTDGVHLGTAGPYEHARDDSMKLDAEESYTPYYDESVGSIYIGNGQIIEFCHTSYSDYLSEYLNATEFQKSSFTDGIDRQYMFICGEVSDIHSDGVISVWCDSGFADVKITNEQMHELSTINKDDEVHLFGKIDVNSYDSWPYEKFYFNEGILVAVGDREIDIPVFGRLIYGIQSTDLEVSGSFDEQSTRLIREWETSEWYYEEDDLFGGQYYDVDGEVCIFFIYTCIDENGNLIYYWESSREIGMDPVYEAPIIETVICPSGRISEENSIVAFYFDDYYGSGKWGGKLELQHNYDGFYCRSSVPEIGDTNGEWVFIENVY